MPKQNGTIAAIITAVIIVLISGAGYILSLEYGMRRVAYYVALSICVVFYGGGLLIGAGMLTVGLFAVVKSIVDFVKKD